MRNVIGVILGGGQGARLFPLTQLRSKPAVPIGGKYRLIDIPISNCLHSGVNRIFALTQFNSASLHRHISTTYRFDSFSDGFVEILAAEQTQDSADWYQGTADAVRQQLRQVLSRKAEQVLILSGDHLYRMDYRAFVEKHRERGADVSIAVKPVTRAEAPALGILQADAEGRIRDTSAKSHRPTPNLRRIVLARRTLFGLNGASTFSSRRSWLACWMSNDQDDFGKHIIPDAIHKIGVFAHSFEGYWEDIGTIRSFYEPNLALTDPQPPF